MTVLNPLRQIDERIMDDADMAGPVCFFLAFGMFLLLVRSLLWLHTSYAELLPFQVW